MIFSYLSGSFLEVVIFLKIPHKLCFSLSLIYQCLFQKMSGKIFVFIAICEIYY